MTKGKRRSQQEWESIFQHQKDSDLNVQAYCEQHNMCSKTFYAHRRKSLIAENDASPFIKIKKTSGVTLLVNNASVLHYQNCKIHLHANADANWDAQIMKALS
ncbi:hypothetical protein MNBD_GAMMA08-784 [hydrothermal vent metagenome]|uniref:Mobile element protein n=1 Tax=hydrothermal vent metagenome TaxID=652676 RepID=A0A3B0XTA1_9ZZZZ